MMLGDCLYRFDKAQLCACSKDSFLIVRGEKMQNSRKNRFVSGKSAFTLVEMLVVIAVILILAGMLLPALNKAREKARQSNCENNLHQFSVAVMLYKQDHRDNMPPWLSSLVPQYIPRGDIFVCKSDRTEGSDGSKPNAPGGGPDDDHPVLDKQYSETDDNKGRNGITACSYLYEFSAATCDWWNGYIVSGGSSDDLDTNGDGIVSWCEAKVYQLAHGDNTNGNTPYDETCFPMIRCFWHFQEMSYRVIHPLDGPQKLGLTINVAYAGNVFRAPVTWELKPVR